VGDTILFNNEEICIKGKTFFWKEWFTKGIKRIENLLDDQGQVLPFPVFQIFVEENLLPSLLPSYFCYSRSPPDKSKNPRI